MFLLLGASCDEMLEQTLAIEQSMIQLSPFGDLKMTDVAIDEMQLIDKEHALVRVKSRGVYADCSLQILGPKGFKTLKLNADLASFGRVFALSNVLNKRVAVAIGTIDDDKRRIALRLAILNLDQMQLEHVSDVIEPTNEEHEKNHRSQMFSFLKHSFLYYDSGVKLKLQNDHRIIVSTIALATPDIIVYHPSTKRIDRISLYKAPAEEISAEMIAALDNGLVYAAAHSVDENSINLYQIDSNTSQVVAVQLFNLNDKRILSLSSLAATDSGLIVAGALTDQQCKKKGVVLKFDLDATARVLKLAWHKIIDISGNSDVIHSVAALSDGRILVAGDTDFSQVCSMSVVKSGDCFIGVLDESGQLLEKLRFGTHLNDHFISLSAYGDTFSVVSMENISLTHDLKQTEAARYKIRTLKMF